MKTAMQDVLDLVQKRLNEFDGLNGFEVTMMRQELNWFKEILSNNIEKEKMQICNAFLEGKVNHSKDWAYEYFYQTYNQEPKKEYQPSEKYVKKQKELMEDSIWNKMNKNNQNK